MSSVKTTSKSERRKFLLKNLLRGFLWFGVIIAILVIFQTQVTQETWEAWTKPLKDDLTVLYALFFMSETIVGIIPPEIIMYLFAEEPFLSFAGVVGMLAVFSYIAGVVAFYIGRFSNRIPLLRRFTTTKRFRNIQDYYHKYGGFLIIVAAVTPVPFGLVSWMAGYLQYDFRKYFLYASPRFLRFALYGYLIWEGFELF